MAAAQQRQIVQVGQAHVVPVVDVVGVAPGDLAVTAREAAAAIACCGGPEQIERHGVCRSPVAQDGVIGADHPVDHAVTQQRLGGQVVDDRAVGGPPHRAFGEGVGVEVQLDMGALPSRAGPVVVGVEERTDINQRIGARREMSRGSSTPSQRRGDPDGLLELHRTGIIEHQPADQPIRGPRRAQLRGRVRPVRATRPGLRHAGATAPLLARCRRPTIRRRSPPPRPAGQP